MCHYSKESIIDDKINDSLLLSCHYYRKNYQAREVHIRYRQRFFDQVGHEIMYASGRNKHFFTNNVTIRATKIMNRADKNWAHFR